MKVLLTGATGFTGSRVLPLIVAQATRVRCLVRSAEKAAGPEGLGAEIVLGDMGDPAALARAFAGCDTLVNIASMGFGHGPLIVRAAQAAGVRRAIFMSTTAIFTSLNVKSKTVRLQAETAVRGSGLEWTILRPTMIYGSDRDRNICRLIWYLRRFPVLPVFGNGDSLLQPVYVDDLAAGVIAALRTEATVRKEYNLAGDRPMTFNLLVRTVSALMGRKTRFWHLPGPLAVKTLWLAEHCRIKLPLKSEQVARLFEDKVFSWADAGRDFGYAPRSFAEGVRLEIHSMGLPATAPGLA